jgi:hypothetical protein
VKRESYRIAVLAGDGIGPEVVSPALEVLDAARAAVGGFEIEIEPLEALGQAPHGASAWAQRFPGRVAAFENGRRHLLMRYVTQPTRRLHSASDCYRGAGYAIDARPLRVDPDGRRWGCFRAQRGQTSLLVCESIGDALGGSWSDVSRENRRIGPSPSMRGGFWLMSARRAFSRQACRAVTSSARA